MRWSAFFVILLTANAAAFVEDLVDVVHVIKLGREIITEILKTWQVLDESGVELPMSGSNSLRDKEKIILAKIDLLAVKVDQVADNTAATMSTVQRMMNSLPKLLAWRQKMDTLSDRLHYIFDMHSNMVSYAKHQDELERHTLENFAESVTSHDARSIRGSMQKIHAMIVPRDLVDKGIFIQLTNTFQDSGINQCNLNQSPNQLLYNLYNLVALADLKGYAMMQFSWMLLRLYNKGNFTLEANLLKEKIEAQTKEKAQAARYALQQANKALWKCDPQGHMENETFVQLTELLQGHVQNEVDLNNENTCRENCAYYTYAKVHGCYHSLYCSKQKPCNGRLFNCKYIDSDSWICQSPSSTRRYDWIEYENGRILGNKGTCTRGSTKVDSWWRWLFWHCSYCFCICDDKGTTSDRYFNLREVTANFDDNKIVTGIRFVKVNKIIHIQVQQAEALPYGTVNKTTIGWKPVDNYHTTDTGVYNGEDYHTMTWEQRSLDLDDLFVPNGHVLTGIRFRRLGTHINPEILATPINYTTGALNPGGSVWIGNDNTDAAISHPRTQVFMSSPDIPTKSAASNFPDSKTDQFIQFTHSDMDKDVAQTTVPFLDAQPVVPSPPTWLAGAGVFHKGTRGYGGFVALKIFTYDFSPYLNASFPKE